MVGMLPGNMASADLWQPSSVPDRGSCCLQGVEPGRPADEAHRPGVRVKRILLPLLTPPAPPWASASLWLQLPVASAALAMPAGIFEKSDANRHLRRGVMRAGRRWGPMPTAKTRFSALH